MRISSECVDQNAAAHQVEPTATDMSFSKSFVSASKMCQNCCTVQKCICLSLAYRGALTRILGVLFNNFKTKQAHLIAAVGQLYHCLMYYVAVNIPARSNFVHTGNFSHVWCSASKPHLHMRIKTKTDPPASLQGPS